MTRPVEVRCAAPHPTVRGWTCRARLYAAEPDTVDITPRDNGVPRGCLHLICPKCGTEYVACPRDRAA